MNIGESDAEPARYAKLGNADERKDQPMGECFTEQKRTLYWLSPNDGSIYHGSSHIGSNL
jgi:hypothetical protein